MSKSNKKNRGIFSPTSENEGKTVSCRGRLFVIEDGRRVWLEEPPADMLPDLLAYAPVRRVEAEDEAMLREWVEAYQGRS